jgi:hypothetical protein
MSLQPPEPLPQGYKESCLAGEEACLAADAVTVWSSSLLWGADSEIIKNRFFSTNCAHLLFLQYWGLNSVRAYTLSHSTSPFL